MMHSSSSLPTLSRLTGIVGLALVLMACGTDDSQQAQTTDATTAASASADTIEVTMKDFAYEPDTLTVPAGQQVTLAFANTGTVEHYFVVGDTITQDKDGFEQNLFSDVSTQKSKQTEGHEESEEEEHEEEEGDHANVFELPPGGSGTMTFALPPEKAGTYTIACFETTGNKKHYEMGMRGILTVTASSN
jgi:uncharacterized cupredoxin-like copper-binding protein